MAIREEPINRARLLREQADAVVAEAKRRAAGMHVEASRLEAAESAARTSMGSSQMVDRLASRLDQLQHPTAILFDKQWGSTTRVYRYAAVKDDGGLWNTTGPKSPKKYSSREFALWLAGVSAGSGQPVKEVRIALSGFYVWGNNGRSGLEVTQEFYDDRA